MNDDGAGGRNARPARPIRPVAAGDTDIDREKARRIIKVQPFDTEYIARHLVDGVFDWTEHYESRAHAAVDHLAAIARYRQVYFRRGEFATLFLPDLEVINDTLLAFGAAPAGFGTFEPRDQVELALELALPADALEHWEGEPHRDDYIYSVYWPEEQLGLAAEAVQSYLETPALWLLRGLWWGDFEGGENELIVVDRSFVPIRRPGAARALEQRSLTALGRLYGLFVSDMKRHRHTEVIAFLRGAPPESVGQEYDYFRPTLDAVAERHGLTVTLYIRDVTAALPSDGFSPLIPTLRNAVERVRWRQASHLILPTRADLPDSAAERAEIADILEEARVPLVTAERLFAPDEARFYLLAADATAPPA
jgi:hypothetical protein